MAISKLLIISILISLIVLLPHVEADQTEEKTSGAARYTAMKIDCDSACIARCQLASRQRMCKRACGSCCARCNCVPPGTSGNQEACPCYAGLTTHGGRRKCP